MSIRYFLKFWIILVLFCGALSATQTANAQIYPTVDRSSYQLDALHRELVEFFPFEAKYAIVPVTTAVMGDQCVVEIPGLPPLYGTVSKGGGGSTICEIKLNHDITCSVTPGKEIDCKDRSGKYLMTLRSMSEGGGEMPTIIQDYLSSLAEFFGLFPG